MNDPFFKFDMNIRLHACRPADKIWDYRTSYKSQRILLTNFDNLNYLGCLVKGISLNFKCVYLVVY